MTLADGRRIYYREAGSGERTLLLIHGNLSTGRWWEPTMSRLPAGIRVVAPDLPGCGESDRRHAPWSVADLAHDLATFARLVGIGRCTVVGHSLGGAVAQQLTVDQPELVERLLLVNSAEPAGLKTPPEKYAQLEALVAQPDVLKAVLAAMAPTAPRDAFLDGLLTESVAKSAGAMVQNGRALDAMDLVAAVGAIRVPVLLLYGQQDRLITLDMMQRAYTQIPGAVLELWPDVGHSPNLEAPDRLAARLLAFMGA